ncbi:YjbQ family protein [Candidatus Woesearchaeota archaeon]|nr:YjbQ family protein [Candidatus Woesearchaeota archaeon]
MKTISISTSKHNELISITDKVQSVINNSKVQKGLCVVYCPHTTAAITINEDADPTVKTDLLHALNQIVSDNWNYQHSEGNSPGHVKSSLIGCSEKIIIIDGKLQLGQWQGIFFCEFDGPRNRKVQIKIIEG